MKPVSVNFENNGCIIRLTRTAKLGVDESYTATTASGTFISSSNAEKETYFRTTVRLREEAAQALLIELTKALEDLKAQREAYLMDSQVYAA